MSKFPKVLTPRLGEDALPGFFQVELKKHFELVPQDEYEKCPEKYDKGFFFLKKSESSKIFLKKLL